MKWTSSVVCFWASLVLLQFHGCLGCLQQERIALLEFKSSVNWSTDAAPLLNSWVDDRGSDCCAWERVKCNRTTGRVIHLSLNYTREDWDSNWFLNVTLFLPFEDLQRLDLSENNIKGWLNNEGFEILSKLKNLEILYLDGNRFNSSIIPSLGALTSLKTLSLRGSLQEGSFVNQDSNFSWSRLTKLEHQDLTGNYLNQSNLEFLGSLSSLRSLSLRDCSLEGPLFTQGSNIWSRLSKLEHLDLSENHLEGPLFLQGLAIWSNLEILDLSSNNFIGSIPPSLGALTSLKTLSLMHNFLNGSLPIKGLCQLKNLQELDLSANNFEGILPPCLNNLTSIRILDLSNNHFKGNIPSSLITPLTSLQYIDLRHNHFEGTFLFSSFANHSKLEVVRLTSDDNKLEVKTDYPPWVPLFQLKVLVLSNCTLNKPSSTIPKFLSSQSDLLELDLSYNNLTGSFPNWLLKNNTRLESLKIMTNSITGHFHPQSYINTATSRIDVSKNQIEGKLPENIGLIFPNLNYLNMSENRFEGSIPSSIGDMRMLKYLDLSHNNFSGEMPEDLAIGCISLDTLKLSNNRLQDQLFSTHFNSTSLSFLYLDNNQFIGNILNGMSNWSQLEALNIGNNYIQGRIPSKIGKLTNLWTLVMRDNLFEGQIPMELCKLVNVRFLDLSQNYLSGSIPSCLNSPVLRYMHLEGNRLAGSIPNSFLNDSSLITLDIRNNNLSGRIPNSIVALSNLRVLLLKDNHFHGPIPIHLCQLYMLGILDLSHNSFYGSIPRCFNNISFGRINVMEHAFMGEFIAGESEISSEPIIGNRIEPYKGRESITYEHFGEQEEVEFLTKSHASSYKGDIINFMFGIDLSCNHLTGDIPHELGDLSGIRALNLSHNQLTGSIPKTLSNLKQIESLDLSHNKLSGEIPSELIGLNFLEVFTVAYNNLSGRTPDWKAQFGTFEGASYEGNPFLCGPSLRKNCTPIVESTLPSTSPSNELKDKYGIDFVSFFASFIASYITCLLAFAVVLYINPYWRRMWLDLIDACIMSCFYFVLDTVYKLSSYLYR